MFRCQRGIGYRRLPAPDMNRSGIEVPSVESQVSSGVCLIRRTPTEGGRPKDLPRHRSVSAIGQKQALKGKLDRINETCWPFMFSCTRSRLHIPSNVATANSIKVVRFFCNIFSR